MLLNDLSSSICINIHPENGLQELNFCNNALIMGNPDGLLFRFSLLDVNGKRTILTNKDGLLTKSDENALKYHYSEYKLTACPRIIPEWGSFSFLLSIENSADQLIEWVEYPILPVPALKKNGGDGQIVFPYNEGALIDDIDLRENSKFPYQNPEYPSRGSYAVFPNMLSSQMMLYLSPKGSLYLGAHDRTRGIKQFDFRKLKNGIEMFCRIYSGGNYGGSFEQNFPMVLSPYIGGWYEGADLYKKWMKKNLPEGMVPVRENTNLPAWYCEPLLVITYPVRGIHDTDKMEPNALFPYTRALPMIRDIEKKAGCRVLVLLMHWEGTAPWAPPFVWPPYGGEDCFRTFLDALHEQDDLLGVYCSGFGFTMKSNLTDYDCSQRYKADALESIMCASPENKVETSRICTDQRYGYDLCPITEKAKALLSEAYDPLLNSGVDYAQILDQNHGGGQYFCYSRNHQHPPCPGPWMTENMQSLLTQWQKKAGKMLLGCESAASEPFIPNLLMSDNRFELNYHTGYPIPLYAYLYHEYVHNFMGNQVCCGLSKYEDTLCYRLAYSFTIGDVMTLVLTPDGELMRSWGDHDFTNLPDKEKALSFISTLIRFQCQWLIPHFAYGKMIQPEQYQCENIFFRREENENDTIELPAVLTSAWETDGQKIQIFVNPINSPQTIIFKNKKRIIPALDAWCTDENIQDSD